MIISKPQKGPEKNYCLCEVPLSTTVPRVVVSLQIRRSFNVSIAFLSFWARFAEEEIRGNGIKTNKQATSKHCPPPASYLFSFSGGEGLNFFSYLTVSLDTTRRRKAERMG